MMGAIKGIATILGLIPGIKSLLDRAIGVYLQAYLEGMRDQNREAIKRAVALADQRELEKVINSPTAGELSGISGTEVRDSLPGVK